MIFKNRPIPRKLLFNCALLGRVPSSHPGVELILNDNKKRDSGYYGEKQLDTFLAYLPEKNYHILNDLRLPNRFIHYQIDSLIITPYFILDADSKNMNGELHIDDDSDVMIQISKDEKKTYDNPLLQSQFRLRQLRELLAANNFPWIPLEYLIMMANQSCEIKTKTGSNAWYRVCKGRRFVFRIEEFSQKYQKVVFTQEMIEKLCNLLLKSHAEKQYDFQKLYKISESDILPGVHCPSCKYLGMKYHQGSWRCSKCGCSSRNAHIAALRDYYLLFGPQITNQQFRSWLGIDSVNVASKLLCKMKLPHSTAKKNRVYTLSFSF